MTVNNDSIRPIEQSQQKQETKFEIKDGVLTLPNGKSYTVSVTVGGQNKTLNEHQTLAVQNLINETFKQLKTDTTQMKDLTELTITHKSSQKGKAEVISTVGQQKIKEFVNIGQQFNAFEQPSAESQQKTEPIVSKDIKRDEIVQPKEAKEESEPVKDNDLTIKLISVESKKQFKNLKKAKASLKAKKQKAQWRNFTELGFGKAKRVWEKEGDTESAYLTPMKQQAITRLFQKSKKTEIKEEVETANQIKEELDPEPEEELNLAVDLTVLEDEKIQGEYTVKTTRAGVEYTDETGAKKTHLDLDKRIHEAPPTFPDSAAIGEQVLNGMVNIHKAGFVHGDLKLENVLIYKGSDGKILARISDFGKTRRLGNNKTAMYTGNARFASPEGKLSKKGEVFSTAVMLIRVLEGELIQKNTVSSKVLISPTRPGKTFETSQREGVEKFLTTSQDCPQNETKSLKGKVQVYGRTALVQAHLDPKKLYNAQIEIHSYISELRKQLIEEHGSDEKKINAVCNLLMKMTNSIPKERPSMEEALTEYKHAMTL